LVVFLVVFFAVRFVAFFAVLRVAFLVVFFAALRTGLRFVAVVRFAALRATRFFAAIVYVVQIFIFQFDRIVFFSLQQKKTSALTQLLCTRCAHTMNKNFFVWITKKFLQNVF